MSPAYNLSEWCVRPQSSSPFVKNVWRCFCSTDSISRWERRKATSTNLMPNRSPFFVASRVPWLLSLFHVLLSRYLRQRRCPRRSPHRYQHGQLHRPHWSRPPSATRPLSPRRGRAGKLVERLSSLVARKARGSCAQPLFTTGCPLRMSPFGEERRKLEGVWRKEYIK